MRWRRAISVAWAVWTACAAAALAGDDSWLPTAQVSLAAPAAAAADAADRSAERIAQFIGSLGPLEQGLFDDAADGRLDEHTLLTAALVAGGVGDDQTLRHYQQAAADLIDQLRTEVKADDQPAQQVEAIFDFMHRRILRNGYRIEATDLRQVFDEGHYNCVSASVLFNCLAGACGLKVCGLETPGHAMSRVLLSTGPIDVETTCPRWFRLQHDPQRQAEHVRKTLGQTTPAAAAPPREVSPIEMTAMIYYNRGVDLLGEKQFAAAAAANAKALRLDPHSATARGNLLATINNWAIVEGTLQHYAASQSLLRRGLAIDAGYETFALNFGHVCRQWSLDLCLAGRYEEALRMLRAAIAERPDQAALRQAAYDVYRRWARARLDAREVPQAVAVFDAARREFPASGGWLAAEAAEIYDWGRTLIERGQYEAAVGAFDLGLARQPAAALLQTGRQMALERWTAAEALPHRAAAATGPRAD